MTSSTPPTLLQHLLTSFSSFPIPYKLSVHLVSTHPKRTNALYPYAVDPPKVWLREVLVVVSADVEEEKKEGESVDGPVVPMKQKRVMIAAMEVCIYTIPSTSSTLLYVSKVDSTGYHPSSSPNPSRKLPPIVKILTKSFLSYHLAPATRPTDRVFVQLFARSQNQYLFPNSIMGGGKNVLGGTRLCGWWKAVLEEVVIGLEKEREASGSKGQVALTFSLPSYEEQEGRNLLNPARNQLPPGISWQYLPPNHPSFPSPTSSSTLPSTAESAIAQLIPTFPDDPKARFLLELSQHRSSKLAADSPDSLEPASKKRKVGGASSLADVKEARREFDAQERKEASETLGKVGYGEFWERMGFRQECISGDVVGFFVMMVYPATVEAASSEGLAKTSETPKPTTTGPPSSPTDLPPPIFARLFAALLNHDFATRALAIDGSDLWITTSETLIRTEIGEGWRKCVGVVEVNDAGRAGGGERKEVEKVVVNVMAVKRKPKKVVG